MCKLFVERDMGVTCSTQVEIQKSETLKERNHLRDLVVDGRMRLEWILKKRDFSVPETYLRCATRTSLKTRYEA